MKQTLKKLKKINDENMRLFEKKARLEKEILAIDMDIFDLMEDYNALIIKICKDYEK